MYQQYKGDFIITIMFLITYPLKLWCTAALPGGCQGSFSPPLFRLFQALKCEFAVLWITPIFYIQPMTITRVPPILIFACFESLVIQPSAYLVAIPTALPGWEKQKQNKKKN